MFKRSVVLVGTLALSQWAVGSVAAQVKASVRFKMWNSSEHVIEAVHISPTTETRWGKNLIKNPVKPGQKFVLLIPGGCGTYDMRFIAPDGIEYIRDAVQFCEDDHVVRIGGRALRKMTAPQADALEAAEVAEAAAAAKARK
jgi:hypothetical protein